MVIRELPSVIQVQISVLTLTSFYSLCPGLGLLLAFRGRSVSAIC